MRTMIRALAMTVAISMCSATMSWATLEAPGERSRAPGAAFAAAFGNLIFVPIRVSITSAGAFLGGLTGFLTAGNEEAAGDVWHLVRGQNILTPEIIQGHETLQFGALEFGGN